MARQLALALPRTWGGKRRGAGRKRVAALPQVPHRTRPFHEGRHPVHLTLRAAAAVGSLRGYRVALAIEGAVARAHGERFRVLHYSVQPDHLHLIIEAADRAALSRGARGLAIRLARAINRAQHRTGQVFVDRYHARAMSTPSEVRRGLAYVLLNWAKHVRGGHGVDPCSSGRWFAGWRQRVEWPVGPAPVATPRTWLAATGWRRGGPALSVHEQPADPRPRR